MDHVKKRICQVIDIYQYDEDCIRVRLLEETSKNQFSRFSVDYRNSIKLRHYFQMPIKFMSDKLIKTLADKGMKFIDTKEFFSGMDAEMIRVGNFVTFDPKSREKMKEIEKFLPKKAERLNPNWTLLDEFKRQNAHVRCGNYVEYRDKDTMNPLHPHKSLEYLKPRDTLHWEICSIRIQTEEPKFRDRPVACWSRESRRYAMDLMETMDEDTQKIRRIVVESHQSIHSISDKIIIDLRCSDDDELEMIEKFIKDFEIVKNSLEILITWDYTLGLEYIKHRYIHHMELKVANKEITEEELLKREDEFMRKVYGVNSKQISTAHKIVWNSVEEVHQQCISVDALRFDSSQGFIYLAIGSLHNNILHEKHGFSLSHLTQHYFPDTEKLDFETNHGTMMYEIMKKSGVLEWILYASELFPMLDFRSIIGPFWKQFYRYLLTKVHSIRFLFLPEWCDRTLEHSKGGLSLEALVNTFHRNVIQFDIRASYPSTILQYNFCYTTLLRRPHETIKKNNWKEGEDYIRIELSKVSPEFIVHVDDNTSAGGVTTDDREDDKKNIPTFKRMRDADITPKEDASYFVTEKHRTGILSELITNLMKQRDDFDEIGDKLGSKLVKFFLNRIYGMMRSETMFYRAIIACSITTMAQHSLKTLCQIAEETIARFPSDDDESINNIPRIISGDTDGIMISNSHSLLNREIVNCFNGKFKHIKIKGSTHYDVVYMLNQKCYFAYRNQGCELIEKGAEGIRQDRFLLTKNLCRYIELNMMKCVYQNNGNQEFYSEVMEYVKDVLETSSKLHTKNQAEWSLSQINQHTEDKYQEKKFRFLALDSMVGKVELRRAIQEAKAKVAPLLVLLKNVCFQNRK